MGLPVKLQDRSEWRTQHQPIVEVSEGVLAAVDVDADGAVIEAVDVDAGVDVVARRTRNGSRSPSLVAL